MQIVGLSLRGLEVEGGNYSGWLLGLADPRL